MVKKHQPNNDDLFGLDNLSKRLTLSSNRMRGRMAEDGYALEQRIQGNDCRKIHKGGDFVVQKRDIFGRKIGKPKTVEIKTGGSKLSKAQEKKKKQLKGNYEVKRY